MEEPRVKQRLYELTEGMYVEHDVLNIAMKIQEYDSRFKLKCGLPGKIELGDAPYMVVEECLDGVERKCFDVWELNETVLIKLYEGDTLKNDVLANIDSHNALIRKGQVQRYRESMDEAKDIVERYLRSGKTRFSFRRSEDGVKVTIDDQPGRKAKVETKDRISLNED